MKSLKSLFRLRKYLQPYHRIILLSISLAIPLASLRAAPALLIHYITGTVLPSQSLSLLFFAVGMVILIYFLNFIVRFFHYYLLRIVISRVNQKIKNELYDHVLGLSADYFTANSTGSLISRVGVDPQYIDAGIASLNSLVREPCTFLFLLSYALYLNWQLTLITFLIFPPLAWVFHVTGRNLKRYIAQMTHENASLYSKIQESYSGIRTVKTYNLEKYVRKNFRATSELFTHFLLKTALLEEASHPMVELLTAFLIASVVYYGGKQVFFHQMTQADLMSFFATFALMMNPLRTLNDINLKLHQAAAACDRIFQVFDLRPTLEEKAGALVVEKFESEVQFKDVTFSYPDTLDRKILKNVSFQMPKGKVVALVGASGAGKSSIVSLLPRIFDVTGGAIFLDGKDIRELNLKELRKIIAVVSQDVFLFNDTIEENIRCGNLIASFEEITKAAEQAYAVEFINTLPNQYKEKVGDRGQKLSGGQRQRISIARAFLRAAPILILDEATSNLDAASERFVRGALENLMQNRTTLVIAHRLSAVRTADQILVLKDGEIVERGTHEELMRHSNEYVKFI